MKPFKSIALTLLALTSTIANASLYDIEVKTNSGDTIKLDRYKGKVLLVTNTASKCGFTPQYKGLEELQKKYKDQGFTVLGFPSNDFMGQEPGSNAEIKKFCELNYKVTFPLFDKQPVKGGKKQPLFRYLTEESPKEFRGEVRWNFEKFVIDREGKVVGRFRSFTTPNDKELVKVVETAIRTQ